MTGGYSVNTNVWQTRKYEFTLLVCLRVAFSGYVSSIDVDGYVTKRNRLTVSLLHQDMPAKFAGLTDGSQCSRTNNNGNRENTR